MQERLRVAIDDAGGPAKVARSSGIALSTLNTYLAGREMRASSIVALATACGVSVQWLATGTDFMLPGEASSIVVTDQDGNTDTLGTHRVVLPVTSDLSAPKPYLKNFAMIPRYDVRAAAGAGSEIEAEHLVGYLALDEAFLRTHIGRPLDRLVTIEAIGDSMIPTIRDGALLVVDISLQDIDDGRIYVLDVAGRLLVKRLELRIDGQIVLRSDNTAYAAQFVTPSERDPLRIIGQVVYQAGPVRS